MVIPSILLCTWKKYRDCKNYYNAKVFCSTLRKSITGKALIRIIRLLMYAVAIATSHK